MSDSKNKKWVWKDTEVLLTGRQAEKQLRRSKDVLYEITPVNKEQGSWKKWVRLQDMHEITVDKDPPAPITLIPRVGPHKPEPLAPGDLGTLRNKDEHNEED